MSVTALPAPRKFGSPRPKVPPFARYKGTSCWRKDRRRVREYVRFCAAEQARNAAASPSA